MNRLVALVLCFLPLVGFTQGKKVFKKEIKAYQADQNAKFKNPQTSPLTADDIVEFKKLNFFKPNFKYRVQADFIRTEDAVPFEMPTTTDRKPVYYKFGDLNFEINGNQYTLEVYQSPESLRNPLYRNKVFLPYKDLTCGKQSYGGGRYIYMETPKSDTVILDFNKSFNPLCAYNYKYSCPIVPKVNYLDVAIRAGVKKYH